MNSHSLPEVSLQDSLTGQVAQQNSPPVDIITQPSKSIITPVVRNPPTKKKMQEPVLHTTMIDLREESELNYTIPEHRTCSHSVDAPAALKSHHHKSWIRSRHTPFSPWP